MVSMKRAKRIFSPICCLQVAAIINKFTFSQNNNNNNNNNRFTKNLFCEWLKDNIKRFRTNWAPWVHLKGGSVNEGENLGGLMVEAA